MISFIHIAFIKHIHPTMYFNIHIYQHLASVPEQLLESVQGCSNGQAVTFSGKKKENRPHAADSGLLYTPCNSVLSR